MQIVTNPLIPPLPGQIKYLILIRNSKDFLRFSHFDSSKTVIDLKIASLSHLRRSEIPPAVGNASGLKSGPSARFEAWKNHQSPNTSHAVSRESANTVDTAGSTSDHLRLNGFLENKLV